MPPTPEHALKQVAANASRYRMLFAFNGDDGNTPEAPLTPLNGIFYGTTFLGGIKNGGTVFTITPSGKHRLLYRFKGSDGYRPLTALTILNGTLYGTTVYGGAHGAGTVFSLTTGGQEHVLHSFAGGTDGLYPEGTLIALDGKLYGTTILGGQPDERCVKYTPGCGTVFEVSTSGQERVIHQFKGGADGNGPEAGLTSLRGVLYGTTSLGGASNDGTVFAITPAGKEHVVYSFKGGSDGELPAAGLTAFKNRLYGETSEGGDYSVCSSFGCGIVFRVTTTGAEKVIYRFKGESDGLTPVGDLTVVNGTLYGTTHTGGVALTCYPNYDVTGCGTVYSLSTSGAERVLYRFKQQSGGYGPVAGLTSLNGKLYGAAEDGGIATCFPSDPSGTGCGVVFALTP